MKSPILRFAFSAPNREVHECRIEFDWLGVERYYVDDSLVLRQWSIIGTTAAFTAHGVSIVVRSRLKKREAVTEVLLDGELTHENLLHEFNQDLKVKLNKFLPTSSKPMTWKNWLSKVVLWAVLSYCFFSIFKWVGNHAA